METHVSLSELRHSILAVLVGNPLFTEEEQLLANHTTYECEDEARLGRWLRNVRLQDARRGFLTRMRVALATHQQAVCTEPAALARELQALAGCRALDAAQQDALWSLWGAGSAVSTRIAWLGYGYLQLLENLGRVSMPRGFNALKDN